MSAFGSKFGGAPKCPSCNKSAYANESVNAIGRTWHKTCFACQTCKKGLGSDAANACDKDGLPYCKACYSKNFGPKGIGFGNTMGDTGIGTVKNTPAMTSISKNPAVPVSVAPAVPESLAPVVPVSLARSAFEKQNEATVACPPMPEKKKVAASRFGGAPKCPSCNKSAYANESVNAIGRTWHKTCFACQTCKKGLGSDAANACDKDGLPYCKACYSKNFGPKGIGFGNTMGDTGIGA